MTTDVERGRLKAFDEEDMSDDISDDGLDEHDPLRPHKNETEQMLEAIGAIEMDELEPEEIAQKSRYEAQQVIRTTKRKKPVLWSVVVLFGLIAAGALLALYLFGSFFQNELGSRSPRNVPPKGKITEVGPASSSYFNYLDKFAQGGGGININGKNLIVFSTTYSLQDPNMQGELAVANSVAFMDQRNEGHPTELQVVPVDEHSFLPYQPIQYLANESDGRHHIHPDSNLVQVSDNTAVGIFTVGFLRSARDYTTISRLYATLLEFEVSETNVSTKRVQQTLFRDIDEEDGEPGYGTFALLREERDGYLYMFASDRKSGIKVARVPLELYAQRSNYEYWQGTYWSDKPSGVHETGTNLFNWTYVREGDNGYTVYGPAYGDIFWSDYHNTYLCVAMSSCTDGTFMVSYALDAQITGRWSEPTSLFHTSTDEERVRPKIWNTRGANYGGHAYPGYQGFRDPRSLLLSYTHDFNWLQFSMARVDWD